MATPEAHGTGRLGFVIDRSLDLVVILFALWTVLYHVALLLGRTRGEVALAATVGAVATTWLVLTRLVPPSHPFEVRSAVGASRLAVVAAILAGAALVLLALDWSTPAATVAAPMVAAILPPTLSPGLLFWVTAVAALGMAWVAARGARPLPATEAPAAGRADGVGVVLAAGLLMGLLSATQIVWSLDNTYNVDRSFAVRDATGPLPFGRDTLFTDGRLPSVVPENDLGSLEGLVGVASAYLGGHPMSWLSFLVYPGMAALGVAALWRAARALGAPRPQLVAVLGTLTIVAVGSESDVAVRAFAARTGSGGYPLVLVPLMVAYTAELLRSPGSGAVIRFVSGGLAAVGLTLSALTTLPVVVAGAAAAAWSRRLGRRQTKVIATAGVVVLGYYAAVVVAAWVAGRSPADTAGIPRSAVSPGDLWRLTLGPGRTYLALTGVVLLGWWLVSTSVARRFVVAAPLGTLVLAMNPLVLWGAGFTAAGTALSRMGWTLPRALVLGIVFSAIVGGLRAPGARALAMVSIMILLIPFRGPWPTLAFPAWDVAAPAESAATLAALAAPTGVVAAGWRVSSFLPVVGNEVNAVAVYEGSIAALAESGDPGLDVAARAEVMSWMDEGAEGRDRSAFVSALDALDVAAVCVERGVRSGDMKRALRHAGFEPAGGDRYCQFWVRQPAT